MSPCITGNVFSKVKHKITGIMAADSKVCRLDAPQTITHKIQDTEALVQRYKDLFKQERLSDVVLRVGDERFHAHRFVLVTASSVFE